MDRVREKEEKISKFSELLDSLENTEDKKKLLWREIYENSLNDRESARILLNDQILRLAELIAKEEDRAVDINDIYGKIEG